MDFSTEKEGGGKEGIPPCWEFQGEFGKMFRQGGRCLEQEFWEGSLGRFLGMCEVPGAAVVGIFLGNIFLGKCFGGRCLEQDFWEDSLEKGLWEGFWESFWEGVRCQEQVF